MAQEEASVDSRETAAMVAKHENPFLSLQQDFQGVTVPSDTTLNMKICVFLLLLW